MNLFQTEKGRDFNNFRTICEVHRQIYDLLVLRGYNDDEIVTLLEEAFGMGVKLVDKLAEYNLEFVWPPNEERRLRELRKRLENESLQVYYADRLVTTQ